MAGVTVTGFEKLDKELQRLPLKIQQKVLKTAVRDAAKLVAKRAKARVYSGGINRQSGDLKRAITGKLLPQKEVRGNILRAIRKVDSSFTRSKLKDFLVGVVFLKPKGFYGLFLEEGHKLFHPKTGMFIKKIPARPFLRPAFDASKNEAFNLIESAMKTGIRNYRKG